MHLRTVFAVAALAFVCATTVAAQSDATVLARGKYLVEGVVACGN